MYLSLRFLCSLPPARPLACVGCVQHVRRLPPGRPSYAKAVATCVPAIPMQPERYMCLSGQVVSLLRFRGHPSPFSFAWRLTLVCTCRSVAGHSRTSTRTSRRPGHPWQRHRCCTGCGWVALQLGLTRGRVVQVRYCGTHAVRCPSSVKATITPSILSK